MEGTPADGWEAELEGWLEPFLGRLRRQAQRRWAPFYLKGLILPGGRKSIEPMAARVAPGDVQQLHHFVATSPWATAPVEDSAACWPMPSTARRPSSAPAWRHGGSSTQWAS